MSQDPLYRSDGFGMDGLPIVEVMTAQWSPGGFALEGTASVYEGNVILRITHDPNKVEETFFTQATAGGPMRGTWSVRVPIAELPATVQIGDENAEHGTLSRSATIRLCVAADGAVEQVPLL